MNKWLKTLLEGDNEITYSKENAGIVTYWCPMALATNLAVLAISIYYLIAYKKAEHMYNHIKSLVYIVCTVIQMIAIIAIKKSIRSENEKLFDLFLRIHILVGSVLASLNFISTGMYTYFIGTLTMIMPLVFALKKHLIDLLWLVISFFSVAAVCLKDAAIVVKIDVIMSLVGLTWGLLVGIIIRNYNLLRIIKARLTLEQVNITDPLTGLGNRLKYEQMREKITAEDGYVAVMYADVNGLKYVNDNYSHEMGDELITTAADLLKSYLNENITLCRTGGDEFVGFFRNRISFEEIEILLKKFKNQKTKSGFDCSIAIGYASSDEFQGMKVKEIEKIAEQRMYKNKALYYSEKGVDRRR